MLQFGSKLPDGIRKHVECGQRLICINKKWSPKSHTNTVRSITGFLHTMPLYEDTRVRQIHYPVYFNDSRLRSRGEAHIVIGNVVKL